VVPETVVWREAEGAIKVPHTGSFFKDSETEPAGPRGLEPLGPADWEGTMNVERNREIAPMTPRSRLMAATAPIK